jgi:hypothetical protein
LCAGYPGYNEASKDPEITIHILELMKKFIKHMLELPNITLTAFLMAFFIAVGVSLWVKDYVSAFACFLTIASILPIKYYAWKKQKVTPENKQKVIVIKRK